MQDILLKQTDDGLYDIQIDGSDFQSTSGMETAIVVSLFSDSRSPAVQVQNAQMRRGWVGNILYVDRGLELGGLLWILDQSRITDDVLNFARVFAHDSLNWLVRDGLARSVKILVSRSSSRGITIAIDIVTVDNTVLRYVALWRATDFRKVQ